MNYNTFEPNSKLFTSLHALWNDTNYGYPEFLPEVSLQKQQSNEDFLKPYLDKFQTFDPTLAKGKTKQSEMASDLYGTIHDLLQKEEILGINQYLTEPQMYHLETALAYFFQRAHHFSKRLTLEELGQAIRNYVVYLMFRQQKQLDYCFDPAAFAYSMLYPMTDNYTDDLRVSTRQKIRLNHKIRTRLSGHPTFGLNYHEHKTLRLLSMIEKEHPRNSSQLMPMLLAMLDAQEASMNLQHMTEKVSIAKCLNVSFYKGGMSVLIDACLADSKLSESEMLFFLGFGVFLQCADDIQDIKDDLESGNQTVFTNDTTHRYKDHIANRLFHFLYHVFEEYTTGEDPFTKFMLDCSNLLLISSIYQSKEYFSRGYVDLLMNSMPVSESFLSDLMNQRSNNFAVSKSKELTRFINTMINQLL